MKIAIASYGQETSSFSPVATTLETFELYGLFAGAEIVERCREVGAIGGFMQTVDARLRRSTCSVISERSEPSSWGVGERP